MNKGIAHYLAPLTSDGHTYMNGLPKRDRIARRPPPPPAPGYPFAPAWGPRSMETSANGDALAYTAKRPYRVPKVAIPSDSGHTVRPVPRTPPICIRLKPGLRARVVEAAEGNVNAWIREAVEAKLGQAESTPQPPPVAAGDAREEKIRAEAKRIRDQRPAYSPQFARQKAIESLHARGEL